MTTETINRDVLVDVDDKTVRRGDILESSNGKWMKVDRIDDIADQLMLIDCRSDELFSIGMNKVKDDLRSGELVIVESDD